MKDATISAFCLAVSVVVHGLAVLVSSQPTRPAARPLLIELELAPLTPEPAPPPKPPLPPEPAAPPEPAPPAPPAPPPQPPSEPRVSQRPPAPLKSVVEASPSVASPDPPAVPAEPELTGRALTAAGDARWSGPAGDGAEPGATLGVPAAAPRLTSTPVARRVAPPSLPVARFAELSRKPAPPSLTAALARNYPAAARRQGRSGEAKARALIDAQGRATSVTISSESGPGFGAGCQRALLQSQWTPPLGPHGEPTATFVSYRCRFEVND